MNYKEKYECQVIIIFQTNYPVSIITNRVKEGRVGDVVYQIQSKTRSLGAYQSIRVPLNQTPNPFHDEEERNGLVTCK